MESFLKYQKEQNLILIDCIICAYFYIERKDSLLTLQDFSKNLLISTKSAKLFFLSSNELKE